MTTHDCNTCANYKPSERYWDTNGKHATKQPKIIPLSKEQCEWLRENRFMSSGYHKDWCEDKWYHDTHCHWTVSSIYGLPSDDPFWKEWEKMQSKPLVKVWSIDKSGAVSKYHFRGQPDWDRIKRENEGAEYIVAQINDNEATSPWGTPFSGSYCVVYAHGEQGIGGFDLGSVLLWSRTNPVESIRAEIKKRDREAVIEKAKKSPKFFLEIVDDLERNAPKFKVGDWVIGKTASGCKLSKITEINNSGTCVGLSSYPNRDWLTSINELRLAIRDDFNVKRNGHEWLAWESQHRADEEILLYVDGNDAGVIFKTPEGMAIIKALNLPVCPAEVK